jgi:RNA polymerase sigma-54 factor
MALTMRIDFRQTQAPVMTPQLQQAIKLLQLSNLELAAFVEGELEENPLLEREEPLIAEIGPLDAPGAGRGDDYNATTLLEPGEPGSTEGVLDSDYTNVYPDEPFLPSTGKAPAASGDIHSMPGIDQTMASEITLREHLTEQLDLSTRDLVERLVGRAIIDTIDDRGYLTTSIEELAGQLSCEVMLVESVLTTLQTLEPTGVFARDLIECFSLQLAERDRLDPAMETMLHNLNYLAKHDMSGLRRICGVDQEDLTEMLAELRTLDPKPGAAFEKAAVDYIIADVIMRAKQDGSWEVELNNDTLPRVLINRAYYAEINNLTQEKNDKAFVIEKFQSANWLLRALDQRARTILKVTTEIIRQQDAFFHHGVAHLKPLVLADIAAAVKMHESTISRVTTNKYMATPQGLFELKYFFTTAINSSEGGDPHSAEAVRYKISSMINREFPESVLSDERIVKILHDGGVDVARRTVAKYRASLKIPPSGERRRMKRATS